MKHEHDDTEPRIGAGAPDDDHMEVTGNQPRPPKVVLAGGSGLLGRRLADDFAARGFEVAVLTRTPSASSPHRLCAWDGRTVGDWAAELEGAVVVNLAGALVDRRATAANIDLLTRSRVEPTRALVEAAAAVAVAPPLWLQMSTLAIYGDAGDAELVEGSGIGSPRPQMTGVAQAWEAAVDGARADRLAILRTGIVLDRNAPAMDRLVGLTRWGLGGRIGTGDQWVSWIHVEDFLAAIRRIVDDATIDGMVHITAPSPVRNRDMMASLRSAVGRPWSPPTPASFVRIGARLMRTDPDLALTGRRCIPKRLLDDGMGFEFATFDEAITELVGSSR